MMVVMINSNKQVITDRSHRQHEQRKTSHIWLRDIWEVEEARCWYYPNKYSHC